MLRTEGRIHFANAHRVGEQMWRLVHDASPRVLALDMSAVPDLEYTALKALTRRTGRWPTPARRCGWWP